MQIKSSTIIVTGASEGLGEQVVYELAKEKASLILISRNSGKLKQVAEKAKELGAEKAQDFVVDLRNIDSIDAFTKMLGKEYKKIDGIINNAGIWQKKANLEDIPDDEILSVLNTNLTGMIMLTKKVIPSLKKSQDAFIINISSRSGYSAQQGQSVYSASKYGVRGFTEVLREDLKDSNIRVAGIYQGGVNTMMFNKAGEDFSSEKLATFIPPTELAKVIVFLISRPAGIWLSELRVERN
ncbi:MAG: SDR family oxidoreductase [Patescibacteria group bacterium]